MKVETWAIGKTNMPYLDTGIAVFEQRLGHYLPFSWVIWPSPKSKNNLPDTVRADEARLILAKLQPDDYLVLLDERGQMYSSVEFAKSMEWMLGQSQRRLIFLIGGAFGFAPELYARANAKLSLSKMTFSHQMVRLFFLEQLYRAMTILKGESYHNE